MFSSNTVLKFHKRNNEFSNSTGSCRITLNSDDKTSFNRGYSYSEVIFYFSNKIDKWIFNDHNFSSTTSGHQKTLHRKLSEVASYDNILRVESDSLNDLNFTFDSLKLSEYNLDIVEKYFPKKFNQFKKELLEEKENKKKEKNDLTINKKLTKFKYNSKNGLLKAAKKIDFDLKKLSIHTSRDFIHLLWIGFSVPEIEKTFNHLSLNDVYRITCIADLYKLIEIKKDLRDFENNLNLCDYCFLVYADFFEVNKEILINDFEVNNEPNYKLLLNKYSYYHGNTLNMSFSDCLKILDEKFKCLDSFHKSMNSSYVSEILLKEFTDYIAKNKLNDLI